MILTDGWYEEEFVCPREDWKQGVLPLRTFALVFRVLKEERG